MPLVTVILGVIIIIMGVLLFVLEPTPKLSPTEPEIYQNEAIKIESEAAIEVSPVEASDKTETPQSS